MIVARDTLFESTPKEHVKSTGTGGTVTVGTTGTACLRGTTKSVASSVVSETKGKKVEENAECI